MIFKRNFFLNLAFKNKFFYRPFLYYNIYIRNFKFFFKESSSQDKEDIFIKNFFKNKKKGTYIDIGCYNPIFWNNTFKLFQRGWSGINIDAQKLNIDLFNIARPKDYNICAIISDKEKKSKIINLEGENNSPVLTSSYSYAKKMKKIFNKTLIFETVKTKTFKNIVKENNIKIKKINFLNIDCEGNDYNVLKSVNIKKYKPNLICIEISHLSSNIEKKNILKYLKRNNYKLIKKNSVSSFFSRY